MAFNWWDSFYGQYIGTRIHGQLGKTYIYYVVKGKQLKRKYNVQHNLNSYYTIQTNDIFKKALQAWKALSPGNKEEWKKQDKYNPTMSGYNYFISQYLNYWYPIIEEAEMRIKKIQTGFLNCVTGSNNITITAVNMSKSIVICPAYTDRFQDGKDNGKGIFGALLTSPTNLVIKAHKGVNYATCTGVWQVIEFE